MNKVIFIIAICTFTTGLGVSFSVALAGGYIIIAAMKERRA